MDLWICGSALTLVHFDGIYDLDCRDALIRPSSQVSALPALMWRTRPFGSLTSTPSSLQSNVSVMRVLMVQEYEICRDMCAIFSLRANRNINISSNII